MVQIKTLSLVQGNPQNNDQILTLSNFCTVEEEWEGHGEVCHSNGVKVGFRLVEGLVWGIKSPFFPRECACWELWAGWERVP